MATAAPAEEANKKVELMKEIRAHEVAIGELSNLPPSRMSRLAALQKSGQTLPVAVYQKTCSLFFRKSVKSAVTSEQKQLDLAKTRLQKLDQA